MERVATILWSSPPPTSVDERLVLFDDGSAWLVILRPRTADGAVGTFVTQPSEADVEALRSLGARLLELDILHPATDPAVVELAAVAERVAASARETPRAVATFHARGLGRGEGGGALPMSLLVVGAGTHAVEFGLDVERSTVLFSRGGVAAGWQPLPHLETGFITPDAEGLGGVVQPGYVEPGAYGAIAFEVAGPAGATEVSVRVAGSLREVLPDQQTPEQFEAMTAPAPIEA